MAWLKCLNPGLHKQKNSKPMKYTDLRDFIVKLEQLGELKHVSVPVSPVLEMTEICDRTLRAAGPALLFGRHRNIDYLGSGDYQGTAQEAPEPGHLSAAGTVAQQGDHALAGASRRCAGLSGTCDCQRRQALSGGGGAGCRSGYHIR